MNVVDVPQPCNRELYDEATTRYAAMVRSRAIGVHQVGNVSYPGLSDIDLIVVTDHAALDNRFFFSALHRLPERYHRLFLHEPFVLPAWSLRVMRHTTHYAPKLIAGRDVLEAFLPEDEPHERWCRMLESYCAYAAYSSKVRRLRQLKGRETIAVASALRYLLKDGAYLIPESADPSYGTQLDDLRRTFFDDGDTVERVRLAWQIFASAFDRFDASLCTHLRVRDTDEAVQKARALVSGEEACADFDREYAFGRARDIGGYQHELASLGLPFGHLFFIAAHPGYRKTPTVTPVVETLLRNVYRVRRRLTEYAGA
jgi:hypothetical protein